MRSPAHVTAWMAISKIILLCALAAITVVKLATVLTSVSPAILRWAELTMRHPVTVDASPAPMMTLRMKNASSALSTAKLVLQKQAVSSVRRHGS